MGISSDKQMKSYIRKLGYGWERNWIASNSTTTQSHKDQSYQSKNRLDAQNSGCMLNGSRDETKWSISECRKLEQDEKTGWEGDPLKIVQDIGIWPYEQVVFSPPRIHPGEWDTQAYQCFCDTTRSTNIGQMTIPNSSQPKKEDL